MVFSAFFWDFDGTLFDTYPRIVRAFLRGLEEYGIHADAKDALRRMKITLGTAADHYAAASGIEGLTGDMIVEAYRRHSEEEDPSGIRLYPGAQEALRRVIRGGGANYLYTHRGPTAWPAIERAGITDLFSGGVTALDGVPSKPDPGERPKPPVSFPYKVGQVVKAVFPVLQNDPRLKPVHVTPWWGTDPSIWTRRPTRASPACCSIRTGCVMRS